MIFSLIYPDGPGAKGRDTSAQAACQVTAEAKLLRVECLAAFRERNMTADECADHLSRSILSVRPRVSELAAKRQIFDSGVRRKNASGHNAIVWSASMPPDPMLQNQTINPENL